MEKDVRAVSLDSEYLESADEIDLFELGSVLLHHWITIFVCFLVGAMLAGCISFFCITPKYQASSMIYIYSKSTSITSLADLQIGSQLAVDFQIVATTREVINEVIAKLGLNMTYEELLNQVNVTNPSNSHILKIQTTTTDPVRSAQISNALADVLRQRIADVMNTDEPSVVERAVAPTRKVSPSNARNTVLGGLGFAFIAALFYVVGYIRDDTIKNEDDVKKYLNLNILAAVPLERSSGKVKD